MAGRDALIANTARGKRARMCTTLRQISEDLADMVATRNRMAQQWGQCHPKVVEIEEDIRFWESQRRELLHQRDILDAILAEDERAIAEGLKQLRKGA